MGDRKRGKGFSLASAPVPALLPLFCPRPRRPRSCLWRRLSQSVIWTSLPPFCCLGKLFELKVIQIEAHRLISTAPHRHTLRAKEPSSCIACYQCGPLMLDNHCVALIPGRSPGGGGGDSHMKVKGILIGNLELNPKRRPIWAWLKLYLTPTRYHSKRDRQTRVIQYDGVFFLFLRVQP